MAKTILKMAKRHKIDRFKKPQEWIKKAHPPRRTQKSPHGQHIKDPPPQRKTQHHTNSTWAQMPGSAGSQSPLRAALGTVSPSIFGRGAVYHAII